MSDTSLKQMNEMHELYRAKSGEPGIQEPYFLFLILRVLNYYLFVIAEQLFLLNQKTPDRSLW